MTVCADDTEAPDEDLTGVKVEEEGAALELELAIKKSRKLNAKRSRVNVLKDIAEKVEVSSEAHVFIPDSILIPFWKSEFTFSLSFY